MAIGHIFEHPTGAPEDYGRVMEHVRSTGPVPPEGARLVLSGQAEQGWRVITVWDSRADVDRFFAERLRPAYEAAGLSLDDGERTYFEVNGLVAGDLTGAPQPA
ncbi:MAG TPA: hypothetical protein VGP78_04080 [Solirubrobacteraceae bacterium]|jgi:hypothetical protein|nr:hypothetical protein [Solirubrobacteraceae bacterium]